MLNIINTSDKAAKLNNIALCYHNITAQESGKSLYVTYIEDFKNQITHLKRKGYTFVLPSTFNKWYTNNYTPKKPIATIMFDDARDSIVIATDWLIKKKIPFGITVIGRRLRSFEAENGYMNWSALNTIIDSGLSELLSHSYNLHNYGINLENNTVVSAPIMEGPCYLDSGEFLYIDPDDSRWYWDLSHVDGISWAFPLLGSDITTGKPITSTVEFKARGDFTANKIRVWACLHTPVSSGYAATVKIDINGYEVANKTIDVAEYKNRFQWTEREFITIDFDRSYNIEKDKIYTITFTTLNPGDSALLIYSIPDFTGNYKLSTTCNKMTYGAYEKWPARACMIIAGDNGKLVSDSEYMEYVTNDLIMNNNVISRYLNADWTTSTTGYTDNDNQKSIVLGGTYKDGSQGKTNIKLVPDRSFTGQVLRLKYAAHLGEWYPLIIDIYINDTKVGRYSPDWKDWSWQTIDITPYKFTKGRDYTITFKTVNKSSHGLGLIKISTDQKDKAFLEILSCEPGPVSIPNQICYPFGAYYAQGSNGKEDLDPVLKSILESVSIKSGYAVWGEGVSSMENMQSHYTNFIIPRYMIEGNMDQSQIIKNIDILIGIE
jgi:hypothetical protein